MRGHYGAAITHITSGLKILSELRSTPSSSNYLKPSGVGRTSYVSIDVLCGIFSRLQAQVIVTLPEKSPSSFEKIWPARVVEQGQPVVFKSLAHAREMLEIHTYDYRQQSIKLLDQQIQGNLTDWTTSTDFVSPVSLEAAALRDTFLSILDSWSTALDNYLRDHSASMTIRQQRGAAILKVRELDSFISLDVIPSIGGLAVDNQMLWDSYIPLFERIVTLGESIIQWFPYSSLSSSPTNFSLDLGIVGTLFNVAARCRDPRIRRHAISVLRAAAVQDGVWNSAVVADIAEKWVEIEEEGLGTVTTCADVPPDSRLIHFLPVFDVDQCSALVYFCFTLKIDSGSVRGEVFQW
ncbi:hypothetical protein N7478_005526 [Penicillium angulare]|uniref:uncharacterized protein n=1 Tax=Penicillium angulare TaxID=116970 RepID=UPI00253FDA31|nr:uncharacterized protein N7478_005526 [Penicillium angulare]KAJ5280154.1 hypothetical protein N7478_005526 [Penicillium angulare]